MTQPTITIITVCYNSAEMLRQTIGSVESQTYRPLEYIIVDGGSTDGTIDVIKARQGCITRWVSEKDGGIYDAMNKGVALARGEWVIFMNAGDTFYAADTIERIFEGDISDDVAVIYGDVAKADRDGGIHIKKAEPAHNSHRMFFCHQSAFARRTALLRHPFDTRHRLSADFKFFKTLIRERARFRQVDLPVALFDTSGVSNTRRSEGLKDNMSVIMETDRVTDRIRLLLRLWLPYMMCRLRGK